MSATGRKLGELLLKQGLIKQEQLETALEHQDQHKTRIGNSLVTLGHINEKVLATFLSKQFGIPAISLDGVNVTPEVAKLIPRALCEKNHIVPLSVEGNKLAVAIADPSNVHVADDIRFIANLEPQLYIATEGAITKLISKAYDAISSSLQEQLDSMVDVDQDRTQGGNTSPKESSTVAVDSDNSADKPVIRLINKLFVEAIRKKCSDIHIEPFESFSRVRFRIDGSLYEVMRLPPQFKASTPARIKVMSELDISEKRLPQDGRIQVKTKTSKLDIRVSILPTMFGEKVVMRLLDQGNKTPDLTKNGFEESQLATFRKAASQPYGMVLVTGPTGSGKSTTLYGILSELNTPDINISTVEDPVEYNMAGVNQTQMKEAIGMNFAAALRSLLRQDPDLIMVGEIRDHETAEIAIKASLTGHMVFSTLHTNDAPGTISRLLHMGLEPFLITAALTLVEAQRLIRVNCSHCSEPDDRVSENDLIMAEVPQDWMGKFTPMRGKGCDECGGTGYAGRRGIYEVMPMSETLRNLIIKGANTDTLKEAAISEGLITLRRSALLKLFRGETTLEEVLNNSRPDGDLIKK
ncbi:MAG: type IV-A pilus assembly ATPase PilB [Proteobacteria bacterium]|nr:type IV-A pilus assembly ATPase PilB [Pseudomonadota bacterium]